MKINMDSALMVGIARLQHENKTLKQQVIEQQDILNDIKIHDVSKQVAGHIDSWMNIPYLHGKTEREDIDEFAFRLTKYIDHKLRN